MKRKTKRWKIKEVSFLSINELNSYIEKEGIQPEQLIRYSTTFEQIKQCTKYLITHWVEIKE